MGQVFNIDIFANQTSIKIDLLQYVNFYILMIYACVDVGKSRNIRKKEIVSMMRLRTRRENYQEVI